MMQIIDVILALNGTEHAEQPFLCENKNATPSMEQAAAFRQAMTRRDEGQNVVPDVSCGRKALAEAAAASQRLADCRLEGPVAEAFKTVCPLDQQQTAHPNPEGSCVRNPLTAGIESVVSAMKDLPGCTAPAGRDVWGCRNTAVSYVGVTQDALPQEEVALPQTASSQPQPSSTLLPPGSAQPPDGTVQPQGGSTLPPASSTLPQSGAVLPPDGSALPQSGAALPPDGTVQPQGGSALPPDGSALPQSGAALPPAGSALPQSGAALPPAGTVQPQGGSTLPPASSTLPQAASSLPQPSSVQTLRGDEIHVADLVPGREQSVLKAVGKRVEIVVQEVVAEKVQSMPASVRREKTGMTEVSVQGSHDGMVAVVDNRTFKPEVSEASVAQGDMAAVRVPQWVPSVPVSHFQPAGTPGEKAEPLRVNMTDHEPSAQDGLGLQSPSADVLVASTVLEKQNASTPPSVVPGTVSGEVEPPSVVPGTVVPDAVSFEKEPLNDALADNLGRMAVRRPNGVTVMASRGAKPRAGLEEKDVADASGVSASGLLYRSADAQAVPQAVDGVQAAAQVQAVAQARTVEVVERVRQTLSASEAFSQAVDAVASTLLVSPELLRTKEGEIRIQLKPDVLDGSSLRLSVTGNAMTVHFIPSTLDVAVLLERCSSQIQQHLSGYISAYRVSVNVRRQKA